MGFNTITHFKQEESYAYQCFNRAGYLSGMETVGAVFIGLLSFICTIVLTFCLRSVANEALRTFAPRKTNHISDAVDATGHINPAGTETIDALPTDAVLPSDHASRVEPPPPYNSEHPSSAVAAPQTGASTVLFGNSSTKDARWRARTFALSTLFFSLLTISLTTLGFSLQNLWYCPEILDSQNKVTLWMCFVWFLYTLLVFFASSGLVAWIVKFMALWGPNTEVGRGRILGMTIDLDLAIYALSAIPIGLGFAVVELILACQRFCCPAALEEYEEVETEDVELGETTEGCLNEEIVGK